MITNTLPGELFVVRNIANIIPYYADTNEYVATISAIEFAIEVLKVDNIVVCGHSNCGGCAALWDNSVLENAPHTKKWLELALPVKQKVEAMNITGEDQIYVREWMTEQLNIVEQVKHLFSYPSIKEKYDEGKLKIYGWYYIIENGDIFNYNIEKEIFEKIGG